MSISRTLTLPRPAAMAAPAIQAPAKPARWAALDLFRFGAVILMVQGHAFNVLIQGSVREAGWYSWHNYVHGFTAPMFMFAAGLAFGITTFRRWDAHVGGGREFWKRLERYGLIVAIGYLLHLPNFSWSGVAAATPTEMQNFLKVDALQNIGLTMLACEITVCVLRSRRRYVWGAALTGLVIVMLAPWAWRLPIEQLAPAGLAGYVNDHTGSIFPIFPWSGFIMAGIVTAHFVQGMTERGLADRIPARLLTTGTALLLGTLVINRFDMDVFGEHNFWKTSPLFFGWRVGVVLILLSALCGAERLIANMGQTAAGKPHWSRRTIEIMGQETLLIYVVHLFILYGSPFHMGLHRDLGRQLGVAQSGLIFLGMFVALALFAWGWNRFKKRRPAEFSVLRLSMLAGVVAYTAAASG